MRVAVFIENLASKAITTSHMEQSMLRFFDSIDSSHEFFILTNQKPDNVKFKKLKIISASDFDTILWRIFFIENKSNIIFKIARFLIRLFSKKKYLSFVNLYSLKSKYDLALESNKIDILYSLFSNMSVSIPYIATCLDSNEIKHPYLPEFRKDVYSWNLFYSKLRNYYKAATYIVASTSAHVTQLKNYFGVDPDKVFINPFYVNTEEYSENFSIEDFNLPFKEKTFLFFPARYMAQKNHILVLLALKILEEKYSINLNLICVGKDMGNRSYIENMVNNLELSSRVIVSGPVSSRIVKELYQKAFCLVFPVFNGPDNLPPIEAMYFGCPAVVSKLEGSEEQLKDAALYFDSSDEYDLAEKLFLLHSNESLRIDLINKGKILVEKLTYKNYYSNILTIIDRFSKIRRAWD